MDELNALSLARSNEKTKACPVCGTVSRDVLSEKLRRGKGTVFYCSNCDLGFLDREKFDVKAFYQGEYRDQVSHKAEAARTDAKEIFDVYSRFQQQRLDLIGPHLNGKTQLLEVGASSGQFITHIVGKVGRISAIELDRDCCVFLKERFPGVEVDSEMLEESSFKDDRFDVVCAFQVMEHTEDPVHFLKTICNATKSGGRAYVEIPNLYDPMMTVWKIAAYEPFYYHAEHLFYFSANAAKKVATQAGFDPAKMKVHFSQDYNLLNHMHWVMNRGPQTTCEVGLSPVELRGKDRDIAGWLTRELRTLNDAYVKKLEASGRTSNLMLELVGD